MVKDVTGHLSLVTCEEQEVATSVVRIPNRMRRQQKGAQIANAQAAMWHH
jgi:hypothetical protein